VPNIRQELTATVLAESDPKQVGQEKEIRWIYFNLTNQGKDSAGLDKSSAHRLEQPWYKVWLRLIDGTSYDKDPLPPHKEFQYTDTQGNVVYYKTVGEYCTKNSFATSVAAKRAEKAIGLIDEMYAHPEQNPYPGWTGQGSWDDIQTKWKDVRCYYWLQSGLPCGDLKPPVTLYIKVLRGKPIASTTFLFDRNSIEKYFKDHPLPKDVLPLTEKNLP